MAYTLASCAVFESIATTGPDISRTALPTTDIGHRRLILCLTMGQETKLPVLLVPLRLPFAWITIGPPVVTSEDAAMFIAFASQLIHEYFLKGQWNPVEQNRTGTPYEVVKLFRGVAYDQVID